MGKAVAAMLSAFSLGGVALALLGDWLGGRAECVALGLVGTGLVLGSHALKGRLPGATSTPPVGRELKVG